MESENEDGAVTNEPSDDQQATDTSTDEGVDTNETEGDDANEEGMSLTGQSDDKTASEDGDDDNDNENSDDEGSDEEPITYEDFNLPENVDQNLLDATTPLFAKHGLSQEAAQEIIDEYANQVELGRKAQEEAVTETHKEWAKEMKTDREFGGDKFNATAKSAQGAFRKFADDDMVQLMEDTGLNKHPAVLRTFAKIGRDVLEDEITDDPAINQNRNILDDWYKN